ncbi:MAG: phosphate ABC transporter permease subunit PstC [Planctomycetes bacterium]|nr:phosphate ABC transporter permease subunit PstC [Planctomycetota bacterium]
MANSAHQASLASNPPGSVFAVPRSWHLGDCLFALLCQSAALSVIATFAALVVVLFWQAWPALHTIGGQFFTTVIWDPEPTHREFGALTFIYGTVMTSAIAMLIAVPLGVGTAAFLAEIAPAWLRKTGSFLVELLAAIPSVVYGFWGVLVLAPIIQWVITAVGGPNQGGTGIFSAGLVLSIMIVPFVAAVAFDVCKAVPNSQREGSYALGATRWQTIWSVVLPYARPGIIGGCFLALGRALGETMAVTMLIGNRREFSLSPFAPGYSIPSIIANELLEADYELYESALVELGLVLLMVSIGVNSLARLLIWRMGRPAGAGIVASLLRYLRPTSAAPQVADTSVVPASAVEQGMRAGLPPGAPTLAEGAPPIRVAGEPRAPAEISQATFTLIDRLMTGVLGLCLAISVGFLLFILSYIVFRGVGALDWNFFTRLPEPVGEPGGGLAHAIVGSFILVGLAAAFAVPLGILAAVYLAEYRSAWLGPIVRFVTDLLTGVPSIVVGILAYFVIVKPMGHFSGWAGSFALGVMMIPIVIRTTEEALRLVPASLRHASYALGASQWQTVLKVTLPAALPAVITAVFLAVARVVGETAPLLLTAGSSSRHWPRSPNDWVPALPEFIFRYATSASEDWRRMGWAAALVLLAIVMLLSLGVRLITGRRAVSTRQAG